LREIAFKNGYDFAHNALTNAPKPETFRVAPLQELFAATVNVTAAMSAPGTNSASDGPLGTN
jgi:hypothetical protein